MTRLVVAGVDPADQRTSWEVLHARRDAYYREREAKVAVVYCYPCRKDHHRQCTGRALYGTVPCSCTNVRHLNAWTR